jgi:glycerophosphoryl diester phosphodiesterase
MRLSPLDTPFAHRGLHGGGRIENSRAAFAAAIAAGHGIELDVQASRDGEAFVIHDYDLARLTGRRGQGRGPTRRRARRDRGFRGSETIATLSESCG